MNLYSIPRRMIFGFTQAAIMGLSLTAGAYAHDAHEHAAMMAADVVRSVVSVDVPPTKMVRQDGVSTTAAKELSNGKPTVLAFIYTSCTTVCPLTSQILSTVQDKLGKDLDKTQLVSISIDPEYDTPASIHAPRTIRLLTAAPRCRWPISTRPSTRSTGQPTSSRRISRARSGFSWPAPRHFPSSVR